MTTLYILSGYFVIAVGVGLGMYPSFSQVDAPEHGRVTACVLGGLFWPVTIICLVTMTLAAKAER